MDVLTINILFYFGIFLSGLFIGSFLNVIADRAANGKSVFFGRSSCDSCKKPLKAIDLIPLFSFLSTKGRCRYCKDKLSLWYPVSELLTGFAFVGVAYFLNLFENTANYYVWVVLAYLLVIASAYIVIFLADAKYRLIPNSVVLPAIGIVLLFLVFNNARFMYKSYTGLQETEFGRYLIESGFWANQMLVPLTQLAYTVISSVLIGLFFWALTKIKNGQAMGKGDVKLAFLIGLFNGFPHNILAIFLGFLFGAVYSLGLVALRRKTIKDTVPFGPFLILGSVVALVWGPQLLEWYFGLF